MKQNKLYTLKHLAFYLLPIALIAGACSDDDDPPEENVEEVITDVRLIFTNTGNTSDVVTARAQDPDGEGVQELQIVDSITLRANATYRLTLELENALDPGDVEDITEEIEEEDDEHQFFFQFSESAFSDPSGNGNFDNRDDPVNYVDFDDNNLPVGLITTWTTDADALTGGSFRVRLQHQPDQKSGTTTVNDGDTDVDLTFVLTIQAPAAKQ